MAVILLSGCRSLHTVEQVPVYIHDTVQTVKVQHDSTYIDRWHTVEVRGDTVFITDRVTKIVTKIQTDTAYKYIEKPVTVEVEQIKEVERPLTWWKQAAFWVLLALLTVAIMVIVVRLKTRR